MKTPDNLKAIARASMRPCPPIVPARVAVRLSDGREYSCGGAIPWPSRIETRGVCYRDPRDGTTYGKRYPDEAGARRAHTYHSLRSAVRFLRRLRSMSAHEVAEQAAYWLDPTR